MWHWIHVAIISPHIVFQQNCVNCKQQCIPLLDWNSDSAENGCGAAELELETGGGNGAANIGGGRVEYVTFVAGAEPIEPGGGVGLVNEFVAGDNCALLVL